MTIKLHISVEQSKPGSEELSQYLFDEMKALNYGDVEIVTEETQDGSLGWITILTIIASIVTIVKQLPGAIKNVKILFDEVRSRFAYEKNIDIKLVPKYTIQILENDLIVAECEFPTSKLNEAFFFEELKKLGDKYD
jgi:hypothetical protein